VLFLAVILLLPRGVVPTLTQLVANRRARARTASDAAADGDVRRRVAGVAP
jgi:hypothetical protein